MDDETKTLGKKVLGLGGTGISVAGLMFYLHNVAMAKIDENFKDIAENKIEIAVIKEIKEDVKEIKSDIKLIERYMRENK